MRRRRLLRHGIPLALFAVVAFVAGAVIGSGGGQPERALVTRYVRAWTRRDWRTMYSLLDPGARTQISLRRFIATYEAAARTATLSSLAVGKISPLHRGAISIQMRVGTRLFGVLRETLVVPVAGSGSAARVRFVHRLVLPGLRPGERLVRQASLAPRAALLASDGTPLAEGIKRTSPIRDAAVGIAGVLGPIPAADAATYAAQGYPPDATVGLDGLERIFQAQLAGVPGGVLLAGRRVLARRNPVPGRAVRTTIDPSIERAVISAIAGRYAGIVALDPRTGAISGAAGIAFSVAQPPGSTMKIITATGALEAGLVKLGDTFPVSTSVTIDGYQLQNANGEACGGTLLNAFAVSCNSVFAPVGVKLGARRLVDTAVRFGFDRPPPISDAAESRIPAAEAIGGDLAVGSSAIGQGRVEATALEMADVAATIAMGGMRPIPTLLYGRRPRFVRVTSPRVASLVQRMMVAVVQFGTGTAAQIPGVAVAGKTGTAELRSTVAPPGSPSPPPTPSPKDTDAWFVGYAPVGAPRIVVGALFPSQGAGGATAAPAVREVLVAALRAR